MMIARLARPRFFLGGISGTGKDDVSGCVIAGKAFRMQNFRSQFAIAVPVLWQPVHIGKEAPILMFT